MIHPIKRIRTDKGITLLGLYKTTGVGPTSISRIENRKSEPRISVLKKIASALGCDWKDLVED